MTAQTKTRRARGSFRDPSGFVFFNQGIPYRQVNVIAKSDFEQLYRSGLYAELVKNNFLVKHHPASNKLISSPEGYKVVRPQKIAFISYPYEWCFSQLKAAAMLTLRIQILALEHGMSLKDASGYNIQFMGTHPVHIDILSFEVYKQGEPWVAYRQFCQHFLAPLILMAKKDVRLNQLLKIYIDGIPLDLTVSLLPFFTKVNLGVFSHLILHAKSQAYFSGKQVRLIKFKLNKASLFSLITSLEQTISQLSLGGVKSEWSDYYSFTNYSDRSLRHKRKLVEAFIKLSRPKILWDLGANAGNFSVLASKNGIYTVAFDIDPLAVEAGFTQHKSESKFLPLTLDLTNPSSGIGWANEERLSLRQRGPADTVMALALVHHLAISNNLPIEMIASHLAALGKYLIIEFIPKSDSQVQKLLATRKDIFPEYHEQGFEATFAKYFQVIKKAYISNSRRSLYLLKRK